MIRFGLVIALPVILAACTVPDYEIVRGYHRSYDQTAAPDERLKLAAFSQLKGMSQPEALSFLEADGFDCIGKSCRYAVEDKMSAAEAMFGIAFPRNKVFGERQASKRTYQITVSTDVIEKTDDITADARFESGWVPWYRSPRPSDYEVTHD